MITSEELEPIFANSLNRIIIINKEEFYLSYRHNKIENYADNLDKLEIGKFYLTTKLPDKTGSLKQYASPDKILANGTVNENVLNNDRFLVKKVIQILEGKGNYNEQYKLEKINDAYYMFKIILNVKSGINLYIFNCEMKELQLRDYNDVFLTLMRYFKNKIKLINETDIEIIDKYQKSDEISKKYNTLTKDVENEEKKFLQNVTIYYYIIVS
jgi:hypothetical protein